MSAVADLRGPAVASAWSSGSRSAPSDSRPSPPKLFQCTETEASGPYGVRAITLRKMSAAGQMTVGQLAAVGQAGGVAGGVAAGVAGQAAPVDMTALLMGMMQSVSSLTAEVAALKTAGTVGSALAVVKKSVKGAAKPKAAAGGGAAGAGSAVKPKAAAAAAGGAVMDLSDDTDDEAVAAATKSMQLASGYEDSDAEGSAERGRGAGSGVAGTAADKRTKAGREAAQQKAVEAAVADLRLELKAANDAAVAAEATMSALRSENATLKARVNVLGEIEYKMAELQNDYDELKGSVAQMRQYNEQDLKEREAMAAIKSQLKDAHALIKALESERGDDV